MINGIGCDILSISRFKNIIETTPAFLKRCFSEREIDEYRKRNDIDGKPYVIMQNQSKPNILISISYESEYVMAYAVLSSIL